MRNICTIRQEINMTRVRWHVIVAVLFLAALTQSCSGPCDPKKFKTYCENSQQAADRQNVPACMEAASTVCKYQKGIYR